MENTNIHFFVNIPKYVNVRSRRPYNDFRCLQFLDMNDFMSLRTYTKDLIVHVLCAYELFHCAEATISVF